MLAEEFTDTIEQLERRQIDGRSGLQFRGEGVICGEQAIAPQTGGRDSRYDDVRHHPGITGGMDWPNAASTVARKTFTEL
jgi:hypothetical protein